MVISRNMLCKCGCGQITQIANKTSTERGWKKGQHKNYINGHNGKLPIGSPKFCQCGCGQVTNLCKSSDPKRGYICGQYYDFIVGHARKRIINITTALCLCGCGNATEIAKYTCKRNGWTVGEPKPYFQRHGRKKIKQGITSIICSKCKLHKNITSFRTNNVSWCKACISSIQAMRRKINPVPARISEHNSRAKRALAIGYCTPDQLKARIEYYGNKCAYCYGPYEHIDHVKPLSRGGSNWPANLRPSCSSCNLCKSTKSLLDFKKIQEHRKSIL